MKTCPTILFCFFALTAHTQLHFDASKISKRTTKIVHKIEAINVVMSDAVGYSGERPKQYDHFVKLGSEASIGELTELTSHPNPTVRCYAFWALTHKHTFDPYPIILRHIHDQQKVETQFGCIGDEEYVGDFFIDLVTPGYVDQDAKKLNTAQFAMLDSILIFTPNELRSKSAAISRVEPSERLYNQLRVLVVSDNNQTALVKLAKYQKASDIQLILNNPAPDSSGEADFYYTYQAISQFPHPAFLPLLEKNLDATLDNDHFSTEWRELYKAIASYKNVKAVELLQIPFTRVKHENIRGYHIDFVYNAIRSFRDPIYDDLMWTLWAEEDRITPDIFEYLQHKNPDRAFVLTKKALLNTDKLYSANISQNMFDADASENLTATMLDLVLDQDRALGLEIIRKNIQDANVMLFPIFSTKASEIKDTSFIEPLLARFNTDSNPHIYLKAATSLIAYNDDALNRRILAASKQNEHFRTGWGGKSLLSLLREYKIK